MKRLVGLAGAKAGAKVVALWGPTKSRPDNRWRVPVATPTAFRLEKALSRLPSRSGRARLSR